MDSLLRIGERIIAGQNHCRYVRVHFSHLRDKFQAVHFRHADVCNDQVKPVLLH